MKLNKNQRPSNTFMVGFCLVLIGVIGGLVSLYRVFFLPLDAVLGNKMWFYTEVSLSAKNLGYLEEHLGSLDSVESVIPVFHEALDPEKLKLWVKEKVALGFLKDGKYIVAAKYRNKALADDFISSFLLSDEDLNEEETSFGTIYTPAYSSQVAFSYAKGWLVWSDSRLTLMEVLGAEEKLRKSDNYKKVTKDLPSKYLNFSFIDLAYWEPSDRANSPWTAYRPLIESFEQVVPSFGVMTILDDKKITFKSKVLAHEGIYDKNEYKVSNSTVPDLAQFIPKETLMFTNGAKVFDKYKHTKTFLTSLDPQLALVFEGVIKAQSNAIFGEGFDYENKVLSHLNQNYAIALDFENQLNFGFVAQIESTDGNKETIKEAILSAQSRYEPAETIVELPDGTERTELIAKDISTLPVELRQLEDIEYSVVKGLEDDGFSYAFIGPYFVFANNSAYLESLIKTYQDPSGSLAQNRDFRQSVLFDFRSAESYSFINMPKLFTLFDWITLVEEATEDPAEETEIPEKIDWSSLQPYLRNLVLSRSTYPGEVYIQGNLFLNQ